MASPDDLESDEFSDLGEDTELDALDGLDLDEDDEVDDFEGDEDEDKEGEDDSKGTAEESSEEDDHDDVDLDDDDPDEEEEESLDVILAREQDLEDEFAPSGDAPRSSPTTTPPGEDEFTCRSCFLVKRRAQLADEDELICLDCA